MSYGFQIGADSMSSTIRKYNVWLTPGCQLMLRSIDSGGAALTQNQLSAAVTSGGAPLTRGGVELGGGPCTLNRPTHTGITARQ